MTIELILRRDGKHDQTVTERVTVLAVAMVKN